MIPLALLVVVPPAPIIPQVTVPAGSEQASGPRPNRDPDAVPDGSPVATDKTTLSFNLSAVSDYRLRGISQSNGRPVVQGSAEAAAPAGFYVGLWGSTIANYEGSHVEVDVYGGFRTTVAKFDLDAGIISYLYPGADGVSSAEVYASGAHDLGGAKIKVGVSYTPHQSELGKADGLYLFAETEKRLTGLPVTVRGHVGRETGVNTVTGAPKFDWLLGADVPVGPATVSLAWVDARYRGRLTERNHRTRLVAAVAFDF